MPVPQCGVVDVTRAVLFNVRVDETLLDAIEEAAGSAGLRKSVWAREVLGAVALGGVTLDMLRQLVDTIGLEPTSPHPARYLPLQGQTGRSEKAQARCKHPVTAIKRLPFTDVCGLCGATVKRR